MLNLFCQEEFIRRLAESGYYENVILKGGYLIYLISGFTTRVTKDADYLLKNFSNDIETVKKLVTKIISTNSDNNEFINLQIKTLEIINETKEYHGVRVNFIGLIGKTKTPFSIDFGIGDIIVPCPIKRILPSLLPDFIQPQILTYSLESTIAEKLDAIISKMEYTSRMKDFYDLYYLAITFNFEGRKLQEAIYETLTNRARSFEKDSVSNILRLPNNKEVMNRWNNFCLNILKYKLDFTNVVKTIFELTSLPFQSIVQENEFFKTWDHNVRQYI